MGNSPSEASMGDRLRCYKCDVVLPPCTSFDNLYQATVHGKRVHVFNGGEYYRLVGGPHYECEHCFNKAEEERKKEEERLREEARKKEEQKRKEEERRRAEQKEEERQEEERMQRQLDQKLEESLRQAEEQQEEEQLNDIAEEQEKKQSVLISHLNEFDPDELASADKLLDILSSKFNLPVAHLNISELTAEQLRNVLSGLDELLFDEWVRARPSLKTLQHAQVLLTDLCALSLGTPGDLPLEHLTNQLQSFVEAISLSATNVSEIFSLTQALYLNLMHFYQIGDNISGSSDAVVIAKRWVGEQLSVENLFFVEFLGTLVSSLQQVLDAGGSGEASVTSRMAIKCLWLLVDTLMELDGHTRSPRTLFRLVRKSRWSPAQAVALLRDLSERYAEDAPISEVLGLVYVYKISPEWRNDSGMTLVETLDAVGPEKFREEFRKTLIEQDARIFTSALEKVKKSRNLDDAVMKSIKNIVSAILDKSVADKPFNKANFKEEALESALFQLCKAVSVTKGWWPTAQQMVSWSALALTEQSDLPELVAVESDPCVIAMFAVAKVCHGHKVDLVLSSDVHSYNQTKEWEDFYKHLGISSNTNMNKTGAEQREAYVAEIVYGTIDDFVSDYFQYGFEGVKSGDRGFIIAEQCLDDAHDLELTRLKERDDLTFAAESLQSLMGSFHSRDMTVRHTFVKALFQMLRTSNHTATDSKMVTISQKCAGENLSSHEVYTLNLLENLLESVGDRLCLESIFACAAKFQVANKHTNEQFQMVWNLVAHERWSPREALELLGALCENHHDKDCVSINTILHLMETYQVSSKWVDDKEQSLLELVNTSTTQDLIKHLENSFKDEEIKSTDTLFDEIRQMKNIDEETLDKSYRIVTAVQDMIKSGEIKKHADVKTARNLSRSKKAEDLQEVLAVLCNAVHLRIAGERWWPRATQMTSWCFLTLADNGKLLEMGTGEGKSCVIAMFAALRALRGEKVDVVSSSSVLCQRDAEEWAEFYSYFNLTADTNTNKNNDEDRKKCYQKDVVYGTIEAFAADHLRQIFEMKDVRPDRSYQCILIDEVDSLLLDQGVQLTYLSSPMVSMQHLNIIMTMIWGHVCQYGLLSTGYQTLVQGPPASFYKAIFDSINTDGTEINDPMDVLRIAEDAGTVPEGFSEEIYKCDKDEIIKKLMTVSQDAMVDFFQNLENYLPYDFTVYTLDDSGLLQLSKTSTYNNPEIPDLRFLILEGGLCCPLYDTEDALVGPIAELISQKIQYTPCTNDKNKISVPGFLKALVEQKVSVWVQNAFLALRLRKGQEYVVENDAVCPVDFKSTGIVELSKKWGDGLQQFIEIKHQVKLSAISTVTNYVSNVAFFEKYHGKIYGTTGTLGNETDMQFLKQLYPNLSACNIPTFNRKKLFEVKGTLTTSEEEWKSAVKQVVLEQISSKPYRDGRAALVICETINKAKEIHKELKGIVPGEIILYCRSDKDSLSKIDKDLLPGDVIVATNLAGRGTNIQVSKQVNNNGGLFVALTFLSENTRVELQAFGRTARKGRPGSAQIIVNTAHLDQSFSSVSSLEEAKKTRQQLAAERISNMMNDVTEMKLREDLFAQYCDTLEDIYEKTEGNEERAIVAVMNEFWGIWLQTKSEEIDQLKGDELKKTLKADLIQARIQTESQSSPCSSIYHYIKFGNIAVGEKKWAASMKLFEKAMKQDETWAAVAFYNHAYCTIKLQKGDYMQKAIDNLKKAQDSLKYLSEECMVCLQFLKISSVASNNKEPTTLEKQFTNKSSMFSCFDKNITEAIKKLEEIKEKGRDANAKKSPMFSLVSNADEDMQQEAFNLYNRGLKYVFSVEQAPRFPWEALLVFCLGVLQIVGGALLTAFTFGTAAQVGMGLITEGISDCITGIESMVTGEFSWKSWAIEKAISIAISLISFGVGKIISKGYKASKILIKQVGKQMKAMPKFLSMQAKQSISVVTKTNLKNAVKHTAKTMVGEIVSYGFGKAEEKLLAEILKGIKNEVKKGITDDVNSQMEKEPLTSIIDSVILSHLEANQKYADLLQNEDRKEKLLAAFKDLNSTALQPFYDDLSWQNQLNANLATVIDSAKSEASGKLSAILTAVQAIHLSALAADAIGTVLTLSGKFFSNLKEGLEKFKKDKGIPAQVKHNNASAADTKMLKAFKKELAAATSALLADALVEVFQQKFSSHVISHVQGKVNDVIMGKVENKLKSEQTQDKLKAAHESRSKSLSSYMKSQDGSVKAKNTKAHVEKIKSSKTKGTTLDIKILAEATGAKVIILKRGTKGKLDKTLTIQSTKPTGKTVKLVHTPKSDDAPEGGYQAVVEGGALSATEEGLGSVFHAFATAMNPTATKKETKASEMRLRSLEVKGLLKNPSRWTEYVTRKEWTEETRGGDWYKSAVQEMIERSTMLLQQEPGKVAHHIKWKE